MPHARASRKRRAAFPRWTFLPLTALCVAVLLALPSHARAEDTEAEETKKDAAPEKGDGDGKADAPEAAGAAIMKDIEEKPRDFKELVEAARAYFNLDEEQWKGRMALIGELEKQAAEGRWFLKDMEALRWLVYQGRTFLPPLTDRKWQRDNGITDAKGIGGTLEYIKSEQLAMTFSVGRNYPKERELEKKFPREAPFPLLISMHEKADFAEKHPGRAMIKRRYEDKKIWGDLYKDWLMLAPHAAAGAFVSRTGQPRANVFQQPFSQFWKHYHVDFDRVLLDGTEDAFTMANSMPVFWAGVIFRGDWRLTDEQKPLVTNFANVPVYVVDNPKLADDLVEAGHPNVTKGIANTSLYKWMTEQRRQAPKSFTWNAERTDQVLAYWVNLDTLNWKATKREVKAEVVDTEAQPNTIKLDAINVDILSLFLNDDIVDLDEKVRVIVNGHIEFDGVIELQTKALASVGRDFDFLFNREPLKIRESMYFGWLTPARIVQIPVRKPAPPKTDEPKADATAAAPKATPQEEARAERMWNKVQDLVKNGLDDKALEILDMILGLPENGYSDRARDLKTKLSGGAKPDGAAKEGAAKGEAAKEGAGSR